MKTIILALGATLIIAMTPLTDVSAATPFLGVNGGNLVYHGSPVVLRGENFNNGPGLSCCNGTDITAINSTQADYTTIADMGANSVRFGLDYNWYAGNRAQFFSVLETHVQWAANAHLWLIPVMFVPPGGSDGGYGGQDAFWGSSANQQLLVDFWRDFASHFAGSPTIGGYDVFNEPAPPSAQAWDSVAQRITDAVAGVDPYHLVVLEVSSANWDLPAVHGSRILWSSHCYASVGADGCNFPGPNHSQPSRRPFLIGEVGSQMQQDGLAYVPANLKAFNAMGVSWMHFMMHGDDGFGLYQNWTGGDYSRPWSEMIAVVRQAMAGLSARPQPSPPRANSAAGAPAAAAAPPAVTGSLGVDPRRPVGFGDTDAMGDLAPGLPQGRPPPAASGVAAIRMLGVGGAVGSLALPLMVLAWRWGVAGRRRSRSRVSRGLGA